VYLLYILFLTFALLNKSSTFENNKASNMMGHPSEKNEIGLEKTWL